MGDAPILASTQEVKWVLFTLKHTNYDNLIPFVIFIGRVFCVCPEGWIIDENDLKTCIDIDECKLQDLLKPKQRCEYGCVNTIGSYKCENDYGADQPRMMEEDIISCPNGFDYNVSTENCDGMVEDKSYDKTMVI